MMLLPPDLKNGQRKGLYNRKGATFTLVLAIGLLATCIAAAFIKNGEYLAAPMAFLSFAIARVVAINVSSWRLNYLGRHLDNPVLKLEYMSRLVNDRVEQGRCYT